MRGPSKVKIGDLRPRSLCVMERLALMERADTGRLRLAIAAEMCKCERLKLEVELTVEVVKVWRCRAGV